MLPSGDHVKAVYLGDKGILASARAGTLLIDSSTIAAEDARAVASAAATHHLDMIDAPVSGGTSGAETGSLTFIVGGAVAALERARPVLERWGKTSSTPGTVARARSPRSATTCCSAFRCSPRPRRSNLGLRTAWIPQRSQASSPKAPGAIGARGCGIQAVLNPEVERLGRGEHLNAEQHVVADLGDLARATVPAWKTFFPSFPALVARARGPPLRRQR